MLRVQLGAAEVLAVRDEARPLLAGDVVVAEVERIEVHASGEAKLEQHLGVAHGIAVLFAVVRNGYGEETTRARLVDGFDHQRHIGRVHDAQVEAGIPASRGLEDPENGVHYAASCMSSPPCSSSLASGGSSAERMRPAVC